jgi:hypothetical protein
MRTLAIEVNKTEMHALQAAKINFLIPVVAFQSLASNSQLSRIRKRRFHYYDNREYSTQVGLRASSVATGLTCSLFAALEQYFIMLCWW